MCSDRGLIKAAVKRQLAMTFRKGRSLSTMVARVSRTTVVLVVGQLQIFAPSSEFLPHQVRGLNFDSHSDVSQTNLE